MCFLFLAPADVFMTDESITGFISDNTGVSIKVILDTNMSVVQQTTESTI